MPENDKIEEDDVKRSKGSYQKVIVADDADLKAGIVKKRIYKQYYVFEIQLNQKVLFHLNVLHAKNLKETGENVYWIGQSIKNFGKPKYLGFIGSNNEHELHELYNNLNKGTKYEKKYLDDGYTLNKNYRYFTAESTNWIGKKYVATNPYKNNDEKREGTLLGNLGYTPTKLGSGIWVEGINYRPDFKSQGAFMIAVAEPQIISLYIEKRYRPENIVRKNGVIKDQGDTAHVEQELIYGEMLDIHMNLHNILDDYTATVEIFHEDKSMNNDYKKIIDLNKEIDKDRKKGKDNPALDYNREIIDELLVDFRWVDKSNHEEGEDNEDSLQDYKMIFVFTPVNNTKYSKDYPVITREVTFSVNYKSKFSVEEHEPQYVAQIVKVKQPPLVSQSYEYGCLYKELKVTCEGYEPKTFLKENENGTITSDDAGTTPKFSLVLGNENNVKTITIDTDADVANCLELEEDDKHTGKVFDLQGVEEYSYDNGDSTWDILTNIKLMPQVQPYKETVTQTDQKLEFKAAYPYDASNEHLFLWRYLFMHLLQYKNPAKFFVRVQSCRYTRTIWFNVHPDVLWSMHIAYDADTILYHDNIEVPLVRGSANYVSALASLAKQGYKNIESLIDSGFDKLKPFFETFKSFGSAQESWNKAKEIINGFFDDSITYMHLGFNARYDIPEGDTGTIINYSKIQPYKFVLNYYIFQIIMLTLAVDILLIYLTRGKVAPSLQKAQKIAKRFKKIKGTFDNALDKYNLTLQTPKISMNAGLHKEMQSKGHYATIFDYTLQAKPFLGLATEYKYDTDALKKGKFKTLIKKLESKAKSKINGKFILTLNAEGNIWYDINISFNTHTNEFTLNNNAQYQENDYNKVLRDGDIIKTEGNIKLELILKASVSIKKEFKALWFEPVDVEASFQGEIELHSSVGITKKFGYTKGRGPYLEKILYFGGLKGEFYQKAVVKFDGEEFLDSNEDDEKTPFTVFKPENKSFGRDYLFELFEPKEQYQYENK